MTTALRIFYSNLAPHDTETLTRAHKESFYGTHCPEGTTATLCVFIHMMGGEQWEAQPSATYRTVLYRTSMRRCLTLPLAAVAPAAAFTFSTRLVSSCRMRACAHRVVTARRFMSRNSHKAICSQHTHTASARRMHDTIYISASTSRSTYI